MPCRFTNARVRWIWLELAERLGTVATVRSNEFALRVALDPYELTVFPDGRAIIKGTTDVGLPAAYTPATSGPRFYRTSPFPYT